MPRSFLIYERTDIFTEMPGVDKDYITKIDDELTESSDLVLYVDQTMYQEGLPRNPNSLLIGHGVDYPFFAEAHKSDYVPQDIANIPRPIVGYFGDICDKGFDFDLLLKMADQLPNVSFVLVGPLSSDVEALRQKKNIYILGQCQYEDVPHYGKSL